MVVNDAMAEANQCRVFADADLYRHLPVWAIFAKMLEDDGRRNAVTETMAKRPKQFYGFIHNIASKTKINHRRALFCPTGMENASSMLHPCLNLE